MSKLIFNGRDVSLTRENIDYVHEMERAWTITELKLQERSLNVFLDESGNEDFEGDRVFAMGGCVVDDVAYNDRFKEDWSAVKHHLFKIPKEHSLHAKKHFPKLIRRDIDLLLRFIGNHDIKFVAHFLTENVHMLDKTEILYDAISGIDCSMHHLCRRTFDAGSVFFEHSSRLSPKILMQIESVRYQGIKAHGGNWFIHKNLRCAPMEIADLVAYLVGVLARRGWDGLTGVHRTVLEAMFSDPQKGRCCQTLASSPVITVGF